MRKLIKQYIHFLTKLSFPFSGESLEEILNLSLPLTVNTLPVELQPHAKALNQIFQLCTTLKQKKQILIDKQGLDEELKQKGQAIKHCQEEISKLNLALVEQEKNLQSQYEEIENEYYKYTCITEPLIARTAFIDTKSQIRRIHEIHKEVKKNLQKIRHLQARKTLLQQQQKREEHICKLHQYGLSSASHFLDDFESLISGIKKENDALILAGQQLQDCQKHLAYHLSKDNIDKNIEQLQQLLIDLKKQLLEENKEDEDLSEESKQALQSKFSQFANPQSLLEDKNAQLTNLTSYFSFSGWYEWVSNTTSDFQNKQQHLKEEIHFLERLNRQRTLQQKIIATEKSIERLSDLLGNESEHSSELVSLAKTMEDGYSLLKALHEKYGPLLPIQEAHSPTHLFADLIMSISATENLADIKSNTLATLYEVKKLNEAITVLRLQHNVIEAHENDSIELLELRINSEEKNEILLSELENSCIKYLRKVENYEQINQEIELKKSTQIKLKSSIQYLKKEIQDIEKLKVQSKVIEQDIENSLQQLGKLPSFSENDYASSHELTLNTVHFEQLNEWHAKIMHHMNLSEELKEWYESLFIHLSLLLRDKKFFHQAFHLLRDIHFELEYPENIEFTVLKQYKTLCPNPAHDLDLLLQLKPQWPIDAPSKRLKNKKIEGVIQTLSDKCKELRSREHEREAELLSQATNTLYHRALAGENNEGIDTIKLMDDSRYDCLKKHRGLLKIWQKVENAVHSLISKIWHRPSPSVLNRSCFFKTDSQKLLEKAEHELNQWLPHTVSNL
ncbi:hypothetical protein [Legionella israelensis]|uniref:Effector protein A, substrate of the Dot/Icm secretion system n=1 Tax=Legionella israelensis TaxID=454 RepID=A0A0W0W8S0_9GAMM|nr:hypothetical protein [Legionella israelensis]KTD28754.1 effector protein A, substrate of the Dot/Icm secretion system [Legionella israelensis]QBS09417.1 hypothetical protein E4T55_05825 [Legionella israelensis]SCX87987.1 hypothetical protein SAMN02746069_00526 [Legionella israelensis DSM 19235]STX60318.1 interaptin [Legionella israelensis]